MSRRLATLAALLLLPGCLGESQPVKATLHNFGGSAIEVRLVATSGGATLFDQTFFVAGGQTVERSLGTGTMTVRATYTVHHTSGGTVQDVNASTAITVGGGDCADGTSVAAFLFSYDQGAGTQPFRNDGVKVLCEPAAQ